ncbi:hypothetical protein MIND_00407200 [Mycena indigotica]|uniref:F-box domain-containing protein n=1 Tax=Mycena indigotica TaxID=2126181 RepID=A0A8H6T4Y4_9AGAR|nr:uncharacterized protein MIND_00407200 [Mycena indigotica]KAF7310331.1 hypothetical protein MIND_00407200 [Mycena indigotica]
MHQCLENLDVLSQILDHIPVQNRPLLSALARTCRVFEAPALDRLWRTVDLHVLRGLFACFPEGAVETTNEGNRMTVSVPLPRPLVLSDWERFRSYSGRIRGLYVRSDALETYEAALVWLSVRLPWDSLLPRLHALDWIISLTFTPHTHNARSFSAMMRHLRLFLSPSIHRLGLDCMLANEETLSLLPIIAIKVPALGDLRITEVTINPPAPLADQRTISALVKSLPGLRRLHVPVLDHNALDYLGSLSGFSSLSLSTFSADLLPGIQACRFATLTSVKLSSADLATVTHFLHLLPVVQEIFVQLSRGNHTPEDITALFTALTASHSTLSSLWLSLNAALRREDFVTLSRARFPMLHKLLLTCNKIVGLDDAALTQLVIQCPHLRGLHLDEMTKPTTTALTLNVLVSVARWCPALKSITLTLNARSPPALQRRPEDSNAVRPLQHELHDIDFCYSELDNAFTVARFLSGLFPSLVQLQNDWDADVQQPEMLRRWGEVQALLPDLQSIRREEWDWAQPRG